GTPPPSPIPTMNEWGMIIFSLLMAVSALWFIRRRSRCY
ncbi:MAG: IPTL-CTERM sorting domain-containing protein, partial [Desulfobacteraceae bacterium]